MSTEPPKHTADEIFAAMQKFIETGEPMEDSYKNARGLNFLNRDFSNLELTGMDFTGCEMSRSIFAGAICQNAIFDKATLFQAKLDDGEFLGASFIEANLDECSGKNAGLGQTKFNRATLRRASLPGATFGNAVLAHADVSLAKLQKARFLEADLSHLHASQADMTGCDMRECNLDHATFNKTTMVAVQMRGVRNYATAHWIGADIRDVDFAGAYLVRRHIVDENYLEEFQKQSTYHFYLYKIWWLSSDCGRSLFRWAMLQAGVVAIFGCIFWHMDGEPAGIKTDVALKDAGFGLAPATNSFTVNGKEVQIDVEKDTFADVAAKVKAISGGKVAISYEAKTDVVQKTGNATFEKVGDAPSGTVNFISAARLDAPSDVSSKYWDGVDLRVSNINQDFAIPPDLVRTWYTPHYYAVVAATTLGFGDVLPKSTRAQILTNLLTIFGYFGLGGLMTILGNLLGRRGE
ncbi:MAG: hypothetical protein EXS22_04335 [Pedosphaera sp.]|nr:hypothetical protein [Pedosphaera sp.]